MSDAQQITLIVDGEETKVTEGTTGAELFFERRDVVVARVDGELKDLDQVLPEGAQVDGITIDSPDGLNVLRHSTAHVMAQAVQQLRPDAKLGIGPYITDGFYFDFDVAEPFTPEDLRQLEKMMQKIINQNQKFVRRVVTEDEAREAMKGEPYKLELLGKKNDAADAGEGVNVEVGAGEITIYDNVDRKSGDSVWCDLCRGPHLPNTKLISNAFALTRSSAAYWLGNQNNQQLQRIYGTAWPTKDALKAYQERIAEAERRDHRKLGAELDLFSFPDELGSGLPVFHPKGGIIRKAMEDYSRQRHVDAGYEFVYTPHITKGHLYEVSGHLDWYREGMFPAMHIDAELNDDGTVRKPGQDYYLKPMNCPMHNLIFRSRGRSYRELPLRLFEFGSVYRYEKSGVVHGLTRVRGMTQDDAHIYCTREQMKDELTTTLNFVLGLLKDYGLDDFYLELSTKNEDKFVGEDAAWEEATRTLAEVAEASGWNLFRIRVEPRSTAPRSPCRRRTRWAALGRCPPSSWTSTCLSVLSWSSRLPTAHASAPS
ncbi:threonine--tRNA ligase [Arthrobacter sp. Hiyo8]|nr:threonine--tRNA ligase [Arthrobacter sp. Hiyo8]